MKQSQINHAFIYHCEKQTWILKCSDNKDTRELATKDSNKHFVVLGSKTMETCRLDGSETVQCFPHMLLDANQQIIVAMIHILCLRQPYCILRLELVKNANQSK